MIIGISSYSAAWVMNIGAWRSWSELKSSAAYVRYRCEQQEPILGFQFK